MTTIRLDKLEICPRVRVRVGKPDAETVDRYAEAMRAGKIFPPIVVYREANTERYIIADGEHRVEAAFRAKRKEIEAEIRSGGEMDALEFAIGCNAEHGRPRTARDVRHAYQQLREMMAKQESFNKKYRTQQAQADAIRISIRSLQRYAAEWREDESGGLSEEKEKDRERAKKMAPKKKEREQESDGLAADPFVGSDWSREDDSTYTALIDAWEDATFAARAKFTKVYC